MWTTSSSVSSSDSRLTDKYPLPPKYKIQKVLGQGSFGVVLQCVDSLTKETVALKISKGYGNLRNEAAILKVLMDYNLDQQNIIKFYGGFWMNECLEFEILDISLGKYLYRRQAPMHLQDIRIVIHQLAIAFDALKTIGVIHGDVKTTNIMLVDQVKQPFKVKLIDFGLAIFRSQAKYIKIHQTPFFRAPEIMLGQSYSEAIDIWSLGCVMAIMIFGFPIFPGKNDHELLQYIVNLLGPPPDRFLKAGWKFKLFFKKTASKQWMLKTSEEYWGMTTTDKRSYSFRSLDKMKAMRLEKNNPREADERRECIELLKAMLMWDDRERITPSGILNHPFITMSYLNSNSQLSSCDETLNSAENRPRQAADPSVSQTAEPGTEQAQTTTKETTTRTRVDDNRQGTHKPTSTGLVILPSDLILVQPAPPQNRIPLEGTSDVEFICESDTPDSTSDSNFDIAPITVADDANNHPDDTDDSKPKKKKRKNHFKRFFSWMKRTFCSCCNADDVQE